MQSFLEYICDSPLWVRRVAIIRCISFTLIRTLLSLKLFLFNNRVTQLNDTLRSANPDFSQCFHQTLLAWFPSLYLAIAAPFWILLLNKRTNNVHEVIEITKFSWIHSSRMVGSRILHINSLPLFFMFF